METYITDALPKDGSYVSDGRMASWEHLKDLKESYPIQTAEFAISQGLASYIKESIRCVEMELS